MRKILTFILTVAVIAFAFSSCSIENYDYDNPEKYTRGGGSIADNVKEIDINWVSGNVEVKFHGESSVVFYEDSESMLDEKTSMYHYFDGRTLHIEFFSAGVHVGRVPDKTLTVFIPQSLTLDEIDIECVSADVNVEEISASSVNIETVSGEISLTSSVGMSDVSLESVSGDIKCNLTTETAEMDVETVSGDLNLYFDAFPRKLNIDSVSGDTTLYIPESSGLLLEFESVSGDFDSEVSASVKNGNYLIGDGASRAEFESTSGDLSIKKK